MFSFVCRVRKTRGYNVNKYDQLDQQLEAENLQRFQHGIRLQSINPYRTGATRNHAKIFNDPTNNIWLLELIDNVIALTDGEFHIQIQYAGVGILEWELLFKILREFARFCNYLVTQGEVEMLQWFPVFTQWRHKYEIFKTSEVLFFLLRVSFAFGVFCFCFFFLKKNQCHAMHKNFCFQKQTHKNKHNSFIKLEVFI